MADHRKFTPPDAKIRPAPRLEGNAVRGRRPHYEDETIDLTPYLRAIRERIGTIVLSSVLAAIVTAMITGLVLPRWYRANAVIRPISTPAVESRIAGFLGGMGGGLGGLAASLGAGGNNDAEEYIAILQGFQFNVGLVARHHIAELFKPGRMTLFFAPTPWDPNWMTYRILKKRFDCEYSIKTGNIALAYEARNRRDAETVLGYYIDDLREVLRAREISGAAAAINSMEAEARTTPDAVLRSELYDLIAKQVQRKKMAQVEADFAFRVLDPPAASDKQYRPAVALDSLLVALLTVLTLTALIVLRFNVNDPKIGD